MDGAAGCNNPIELAWSSAKDLWFNSEMAFEEHIGCIVSIGTGVSRSESFGPHLSKIARSIEQMITETELTAERFEQEHDGLLRDGRYCRFNVPSGLGDIQLHEYGKADQISRLTQNYLNTRDVSRAVVRCAGKIKESMSKSQRNWTGLPPLYRINDTSQLRILR